MIFPSSGDQLLPNWKFICNNRNGEAKLSDFIKSTKTISPTGQSGTTNLQPLGNAHMYSKLAVIIMILLLMMFLFHLKEPIKFILAISDCIIIDFQHQYMRNEKWAN